MDHEMEIANAQLWLSRISTADQLIKWWTLFGPNNMHPFPQHDELDDWKQVSK